VADEESALELLKCRYPIETDVLRLLHAGNLGTGFTLFIQHRIIQQALTDFGILLSTTRPSIHHPGVTSKLLVERWVGFASIKTYANKVRPLKVVSSLVSVPQGLKTLYLQHTFMNLAADIKEIQTQLKKDSTSVIQPAGFQISWPELQRACTD
jgi:hypothetical protein